MQLVDERNDTLCVVKVDEVATLFEAHDAPVWLCTELIHAIESQPEAPPVRG